MKPYIRKVQYYETDDSYDEQLRAWDEIKKAEKAGKEWHEDYLPTALSEATELIEKARERKHFR